MKRDLTRTVDLAACFFSVQLLLRHSLRTDANSVYIGQVDMTDGVISVG